MSLETDLKARKPRNAFPRRTGGLTSGEERGKKARQIWFLQTVVYTRKQSETNIIAGRHTARGGNGKKEKGRSDQAGNSSRFVTFEGKLLRKENEGREEKRTEEE